MKKFKNLKNFLYYEWKKILIVAVIIALVIITFIQCNNKTGTDLGILYISTHTPADIKNLETDIAEANITSDVDKDGKITIKSKIISISDSSEINVEQQVGQQIQLELSAGDCLLFLVSEETLVSYSGTLSFADITDIADKYGIPPDNCHSFDDGRIYGISVEDNTLLKNLGINTSGMYIAQRNCRPEEKNNAKNLNAKKALEYIIKQK